jgi:hypothetical protein
MDFDREDGFSLGSPCSPPATVSSGYFGLGSSTPILLPPPPRLFGTPQYPTPYSLPPSPRPIFPQTPQYTPLRSLPPPPEAPPLFRTSSPSSLQPQSKWPINSGSSLNPLKVPPGISVHDSVSPSIKWSDETLIEHNVSISNRSSKNSLLLPLAWPGRLSMMPPPPGRVQSPSPEPLPSQPQAVLQSSNLNAYLNDTSSEVFGLSRSSSSNVLPGSATTSGEDGSGYFPSLSCERVPIDPDSPLPPVAAFIGGSRGPEDQYVDISLLNRPPLASDNEALAGLSWSQAAFDSSHFSDPVCPSPVMSQVSSAQSHDSGYISDLSGACGIKTRKRWKSHRKPNPYLFRSSLFTLTKVALFPTTLSIKTLQTGNLLPVTSMPNIPPKRSQSRIIRVFRACHTCSSRLGTQNLTPHVLKRAHLESTLTLCPRCQLYTKVQIICLSSLRRQHWKPLDVVHAQFASREMGERRRKYLAGTWSIHHVAQQSSKEGICVLGAV